MNSLFRKRNKGKYSPKVQTRSISNKELSELIEQLQKNADQVERNIVDTEAKMQSVSAPPALRAPCASSPTQDQGLA
ncbi:Periplakin [Manis pentadactyla]|nr:Periplakin [Manis pentadactyla]